MIDFFYLKYYLINNEIICYKYNYSLDKSTQNLLAYFAVISLSNDGETLIINNLKPNGFGKGGVHQCNHAKKATTTFDEL